MYTGPVTDPLTVIENSLSELEVLHELCATNDAALKRKLEELHHQMDQEVAGLDEHGMDGYLSSINDHYIMVSVAMPLFQNYSLFSLGFSSFERCLNGVSVQLKRNRGITLALKDLHGQGTNRAKLYISRVCGISAPFQIPAWSKAKLYNEIRNAIAHRCGFVDYLPNDPASLYVRLLDIPDIELEQVWDTMDQPERQIGLTSAFVVDSLGVYQEVLRALWDALRSEDCIES